jgi:hypothetical protein
MTNLLEEKVNAITITQGSVDWKYRRQFSFTSATSYDIIKVCVRKCWHLYENKPHFQAVKTYLDGFFPREQEVEDRAQQQQEDAARQNEDLDSEYDSDFVPETMQQQVKGDIYKLNNALISANEFRTSSFYAQCNYLEAFKQHVTHKSDVSYRKAIPKTQVALKKLADLWLDEPNKERRKYFFLKVEGLHKAMAKKYGMNWKSERFPGREKNLFFHLSRVTQGMLQVLGTGMRDLSL